MHISILIIVQITLVATRYKPHGKNQENQENQENQIFISKFDYMPLLIVTMLLLNRKEKEKLVIKLAQEGKTTREIAKIARISLKDIGEIIGKFTGDAKSESNKIAKEEEEKRINKLSKYAQAFYLFKEKKPLTEVVIALDLNTDIVLDYYKDYLRLIGMYKLVNLYHSLGKDLPLFLHLFNRVKKEGLNREEITDMLETQRNISDMKETLIWLNHHVPERIRETEEEIEQEIFRLYRIKDSLKERGI